MRVPGKAIIASLLLLCVCLSYVGALEVPEHPGGRITDLTRTLSSNEILFLDQKLADFEERTTNQIAVLMIPSLEGDNLEDYSIRLADKWKIGQKGKDNGVIILIVKNDRKLRIEVGYGLEGVLPDGLAGSIIRNEMAPFFREDNFFQGIYRGIDAIFKATISSFPTKRPTPHSKRFQTSGIPTWAIVLMFVLLALPVIVILVAGSLYMFLYPDSYGSGGGDYGGGFGGGFSGGGGGFGGGGASGGW
jgi:uncharacterized protein